MFLEYYSFFINTLDLFSKKYQFRLFLEEIYTKLLFDMAVQLDKYDKHILKILQENAKTTHKEIAEHIGLSVTPTFERIKRLEKLSVIRKYVGLVDLSLVGKEMIVFCNVSLKEQTNEALKGFEKNIIKLTEVAECYYIAGAYDFLLKIIVKDMQAYRNFMLSKLSNLPNVSHVQSSFVMADLKYETAIELND